MTSQEQETIMESLQSGFDIQDTIGGRISRAREASGLSMAQLARRLGVKTTTLKMWETDRSEPRSNRLTMLAAFLNVSPTWLLVGKGESPSQQTLSDEINLLEMELEAINTEMAGLNSRLTEVIGRLSTLRRKEADEDADVDLSVVPQLSQAS